MSTIHTSWLIYYIEIETDYSTDVSGYYGVSIYDISIHIHDTCTWKVLAEVMHAHYSVHTCRIFSEACCGYIITHTFSLYLVNYAPVLSGIWLNKNCAARTWVCKRSYLPCSTVLLICSDRAVHLLYMYYAFFLFYNYMSISNTQYIKWKILHINLLIFKFITCDIHL